MCVCVCVSLLYPRVFLCPIFQPLITQFHLVTVMTILLNLFLKAYPMPFCDHKVMFRDKQPILFRLQTSS